jgi:hypothetical protein
MTWWRRLGGEDNRKSGSRRNCALQIIDFLHDRRNHLAKNITAPLDFKFT